MLVLGLQGSPRKKGNTNYLISSFMDAAEKSGARTVTIDVTKKNIIPCKEYTVCEKKGFCPIDDDVKEEIYPLLFEPVLKDYIWGGRTLEKLGRALPPQGPIAESWEIAGHNDGTTVVSNGRFAGLSLTEVGPATVEMERLSLPGPVESFAGLWMPGHAWPSPGSLPSAHS